MLLKYQNLLKNFRITLVCKIHEMIGKYDYPISILPKINYRGKIDIDLLLASNKHIYVLRRSDKPIEETFKSLNGELIIRTNAIQPERLPKLSLNLLGSFFLVEHLKYRVNHKSPGGKKWLGNNKVVFSNHRQDYEQVEVGCEIYLHANEIDGTSFPYTYPFSKDTAKVVDEFNKAIGDGAIKLIKDSKNKNSHYEVSGYVKLQHDPINLNYWHTEMLTIAFNDTEVLKKGSWQMKYFDSVMNHVIKANAYASVEKIGNIEKSIYIN